MTIIGLISGTSLDGIDAVVVEVSEQNAEPTLDTVHVRAFATYPYPGGLRERLLDISTPGRGSVDRICHLNAYVGELFAQAAIRITAEAGLQPEQIDVIGSHGQTIHHRPNPIFEGNVTVTSTFQIGEPSIIAERTGATTVADFRPRDMAAGGQGAPFAPFVHYWLFRHPTRDRIITNIGGISNITYLPAAAAPEQVLAFDTGPGNMILDALIMQFSHGARAYDANGQMAAQGTCSAPLLAWLLTHPYMQRTPPKSTGREEFGAEFVRQIREQADRRHLRDADTLATAVCFTARTIAQSCARWLPPSASAAGRDMYCCGGGVWNPTLMQAVQRECAPLPVSTVATLGVSNDALEAITFALLARATLLGMPCYLPNVTGAARPVLLGKIVPGRRLNSWKTRANT